MTDREPVYVVHYCRNNQCDNAWIDEDLYNAQDYPPTWRYCPECSSKGMEPAKRNKNEDNLKQSRKGKVKRN